MIGCTTEIDFFLWPRRDLEKIECKLFSRWKGDEESPFKPLLVRMFSVFNFHSDAGVEICDMLRESK